MSIEEAEEQKPHCYMDEYGYVVGELTRDMEEQGRWFPVYTTPPQRKPLPPQSPCEMTQAEGKMFKLGWLECEAAHGIKGE